MDIHQKKLSSPKILKLPYGMEETCIPEGNLARYMVSTSLTRKDNERQRGGDTIEKYECPSMSQYMSHLKSDVSKSIHLVTTGSKKEQTALITKDPKIAMKLAVPGVKACHVMTVKTTVTPRNLSKPSSLSSPKSNLQKIPPKIENIVKETKNKGGVKTSHIMQLPMKEMVISPSVITKGKILPRKTAQTSSASETIKVIQHPGKVNITLSKGAIPKADTLHFLNIKDKVAEKIIDVQTKKVFKDGKWMEETTKTERISNDQGSTTVSTKTNHRELPPKDNLNQPGGLNNKQISSTGSSPNATPSRLVPLPGLKKAQQVTKQTAPQHLPAVKDDLDSFARRVLVSANNYRRIHGVLPLVISDKLNALAKEWAEKLAKMEKMEHSDKNDIGENIYCKTSSQPWFEVKGEEVVENWYNEVEDHNYEEEPKQGFLKTGHFTQLVWKDTKEMGVAFARNKNGHMAFVVANFTPKGNWIGEFKQQVFPPGGASKRGKLRHTLKDQKQSTIKYKIPNSQINGNIKSSHEILGQRPKSDPPNSVLPRINSRNSTAASPGTATADVRSPMVDSRKILSPSSQTSKSTINSSESYNRRPLSSSVSRRSSTTSKMAEEKFFEDFVKAHNYYRKKHGVKPLRMDKKLSKYAQEWADHLTKLDRMQHRSETDYGENIYMKWSPDPNHRIPGEEAVDSWYEEIKEYKFGKEPHDLGAGHFTQLVWADSEELGVGVAKSHSNKIYVVANYNPPGNYIGQFSSKVPPPL